jgi:hypothetical protein
MIDSRWSILTTLPATMNNSVEEIFDVESYVHQI